jgi:hypothetical protein
LAGEAVVRLGKSFTLGGGGWYNKVGRVTYDFNVQTYNGSLVIDHLTGTPGRRSQAFGRSWQLLL